MKPILTLFILLITAHLASAQWSNITNDFTNDLHMPVCTAAGIQTNAMVVKSYPDNGYFVIWEDKRNGFTAPFQVFAQKYDQAGNRLWAPNGVVVSASSNNQQFTFSSNQDYRNRKVAASDHAGGLYITYTDDSVVNGVWQRICVQHLKGDASKVFPGAGYLIAQTPAGQPVNYKAPQLIADNDGGFYVAYISTNNSIGDYVHLYCYKDEGGSMKSYGGGRANENITSLIMSNPCGTGFKWDLATPGTTVIDYNIWPDLQGNCSVGMSMNGNIAEQGYMLCYNKAWKAKQDHTATISQFLGDGSPSTFTVTYHKGDVDLLYKARIDPRNSECKSGNNTYVWIDYTVPSQGFQVLDISEVPYYYVKGATLATGGNINAELVTASRKTVNNNTATEPSVFAVGFTDEIYAAVPYQRSSNGNPLVGYNTAKPAGMDSLAYFRDTLLSTAVTDYDYSLASGGSHAYLAGLVQEKISDNAPQVKLQHISTTSIGAGHYALQYETGTKAGVTIGREVKTGFQVTEIDYDFPLVTANETGNALLTINETGRYTRVSPIFNGAQLAWGAMGKPLGTPMENGQYISITSPMVALDASGGEGVIAWQDQRNLNTTDKDLFMRHLDNLNVAAYTPPNKKVLPLPAGNGMAFPVVLTGISKKYSIVEAFNAVTGNATPVVELLDNYNLGSVPVGIYENTGTVRANNGKPYLDRNYTITPQNNPNGTATINVRLYFTIAAFDALKLADPTITSPGSLAVIKQPNVSGTVPAALILSGGESELVPISWQAVDGGYYLEVEVTGFSNFFVQKASSTLPVTWLGVQAKWVDDKRATVSWQAGDQQQVKDYTVQQSKDGILFTNQCTVPATATGSYQCVVPADGYGDTYYRVLQRDVDSRYSYSKTVTLHAAAVLSVSVYPNPAQNKLYVSVNGQPILRVTDMKGTTMLRQQAINGLNEVNINHLSKGTYILTVTGSKESRPVKFIKD